LDVQRSFRCLTFDRLPSQGRNLATAFQLVSTYQAQENAPWEEAAKQIIQGGQSIIASADGPALFIAALVSMTGADQWNPALFDIWRENAGSMIDADHIVERIDVIESVLLQTVREA